MRRKTRLSIRRKMSGSLACLLTAISVLSTSGAVPTMASESKVKMSYKQEDVQKIGIHVEAENESFGAGESVLLNVYIQNNSGEPLKDGTLKWVDKKETLTQGGFLFESENDMTEAEEATPDSAEEIEEAEETLVPETSAAAETMAAEAVVVEESAAEETAASEEPVAAETTAPEESAAEETAAPEETAAEETAAPEENAAETEIAGPSEETAAEAGPAGPSEDMAPTQAAGPSSDNGDDFGTAWEEDWFEDEDADDAEIEGPYLDEEGNICNIDLAPGEIFTVQFAGTIDEDIYGLRNRDIRFTFGARKPNGKRLSNNVKFQFNTGLMTMLPVEFEDGNLVETNEENTMTLRLGLDDIEYMFEEIEKEKADEATPSEATPSETEKEFTAAEVVKTEDEATPSEASKATPSEAEETKVEIAAAEEEEEENEATPSEAKKEEDEEDDDENNSDGVFNPEDVKYSIETYGVRLKGVKARFDEDASGPAESVTEVSYRVASGTEPGLYFGTVTASVRYNGNTYKSVQGFHINVTGEGQMALRGKLGDAEIIVSGDPSSFGAEDHEILSLQVTEVPVEKEEMISEAMEKKAEETGAAVEKMKAMDIKVIADGEVKELEGPVTVTFAGLKLEEVKPADAEPEEEKSLVEQAAALFSDNIEAIASEAAKADSSTEVWHLDEDAVEMTDMESYVNDDGDVVMETDHFSIFIVVNVADVVEVPVIVKHYATVKVLQKNGQYNLTEVATQNGNAILPGATENGTYAFERQEIYSSDSVTLPNGGGTGIGYEILIDKLSKLIQNGSDNYTIQSVTVKNPKYYPQGKKFTNAGEIWLDKADNVIEIDYAAKKETDPKKAYVEFFDYNVSQTGEDKTGTTKVHNVNTYRVGINAWSLNKNKIRMGVGIVGTFDSQVNYDYYTGIGNMNSEGALVDANTGQGKKTTGLVKPKLENGTVAFKVADPGLFKRSTVLDPNGAKAVDGYTVVARQYVNDWQLGFHKEGDTFTLEKVYNARGEAVLSNLNELKKSHLNPLYSNLFWPLDSLSYDGRDPLFPGKPYKYSDEYACYYGWTGFPMNDEFSLEIEKDHNWYFGMRYDFKFKIGDYIGPMDYYFRGDDDFWLFIDEYHVSEVDIGGIHSSIGAYVNLETWMKDGSNSERQKHFCQVDENGNIVRDAAGEPILKTDEEFDMTVFYMERGGTGSCCYMSFTIPNAISVPVPESETVSKTVQKIWEDGDNKNKVRPDGVTVQLLQNGSVYGAPVELNASSNWRYNWRYTWSNLPKYKFVGQDVEHVYTVREIGVNKPYISTVDGFTITNKLVKDIKVKKIWKDANGNAYTNEPETSVTVGLFKNGALQQDEVIILNDDNTWEHVWANLPAYEGETEITYQVCELAKNAAGEYVAVDENKAVTPNPDGSYTLGDDGKYIVNYETTDDGSGIRTLVTITNQANLKSVSVKKEWDDINNKYGVRPQNVKVQLYRNAESYGTPVELAENTDASKAWKYIWTDLPMKANGADEEYVYTVKEVGESDFKVNLEASSGTKYTYKVEYTGSDSDGLRVKNSLLPAQFKLKKQIVGQETGEFTKDYKFMIHLKDSSGKLYTTALLKNNEESGVIKLFVPAGGETFTVEEIVPMEYSVSNITGSNITVEKGTASDGTMNAAFTIYPGDGLDKEIVITVENQLTHENYFHHTASVTNVGKETNGIFGGFSQENAYKESPEPENADTKPQPIKEMLQAVIPETQEKKDKDKVQAV